MAVLSVRRNGVSNFYHSDGEGSTRQLTDANQNVTDEYVYDSWGNLITSSGTTQNPLKYVGQRNYRTNGESGLMLLGRRYYNSPEGRFTAVDPLRQRTHWYMYSGNNPSNKVDPSGLWCVHLPGPECIGTTCHGDSTCPPAPPPPKPPTPPCPPKKCPPPSDKNETLQMIIEWIDTTGGYAIPGKEFVDAAKCTPALAKLWICAKLRERYVNTVYDEDDPRKKNTEEMLDFWCGAGNW